MKRQIILVCILAAATAGCGQVRGIVQPNAGANTAPTPQQTTGRLTLSGGGPVLSTPAPVQAQPAAQNWRRDLPRNIPYFNMSDDSVGIFDEPDRTTKNNELLPGEGGFIETCDDDKPVCRMSFGNGVVGWVSMSSMAGVSS